MTACPAHRAPAALPPMKLLPALVAWCVVGGAAAGGCAVDNFDPGKYKTFGDAGQLDIYVYPDLGDPWEQDLGTLVPSKWVALPPSTFFMGSPPTEKCRAQAGVPETLHLVSLHRSFEIMTHEVTQQQFSSLLGINPSRFPSCGGNCPVEQVPWRMAVAYCDALSRAAKLPSCYRCKGSGYTLSCDEVDRYHHSEIYKCKGYRLPTEAEWEYAYRAGALTALHNGNLTSCTGADPAASEIAWYEDNSQKTTHPVGQKKPNAFGLYDMSGNVWEYCHDWLQQDLGYAHINDPVGFADTKLPQKILKGGSALMDAQNLRAAFREGYNTRTPDGKEPRIIGFRCARTLSDG